jgi:hypothetical protein
MSLDVKLPRGRIDFLVLVGGTLMLVDTVWGGLAALGLNLSRTNELLLGISFVLGVPAYLLDVWLNKRIAIAMIALFLGRWIATSYAGPTPLLSSPWRGNVMLIAAFLLLQSSKLRSTKRLQQGSSQF